MSAYLGEGLKCRNKLTVAELLDAINQTLNPDVTTNKLLAVAEIGKTLLYICTPSELTNRKRTNDNPS
jgi:hypothetical protein